MTEGPGWTSPGQPENRPQPEPGSQDRPPPAPGWSAQQPSPAPGWSAQQAPSAWGGWAPRPEVKPGVMPLRPIGVGEILDGAISTMRAYPRAMLGLSAIVVLISELFTVLVMWMLLEDINAAVRLEESATFDEAIGTLSGTFTATGLSSIVRWLAVVFLTGMLTVVVSRAVLGERADIGTAWRTFRPRMGWLLLLFLVNGVLVAIAVLVPLLPALVVALTGAPGGLIALLFFLGLLGAAALGAFVYVSLALSTPALVLEKQGVRGAISRSRRLVRGNWWRVFGILLLASLIAFVINLIISTPFQFAAGGAAIFTNPGAVPETSVVSLFVAAIGTIIAATLTYPFTAAVTVLLYIDQRMRREGLDLELARAAGVHGQPGPHGEPPRT